MSNLLTDVAELQLFSPSSTEIIELLIDAAKLVDQFDYGGHYSKTGPALLYSTLLLFTRSDSALFRTLDFGVDVNEPASQFFPFIRMLDGHETAISKLEFSLDGIQLASGASNGTIRIWNLQSNSRLDLTSEYRDGSVRSLGFSVQGTRLVSLSSNGMVQVWNTVTGDRLHRILPELQGYLHPIGRVAFSESPDETEVMLGLYGQSDWLSMKIEGSETMQGHDENITSIALSADGNCLVSGSWDGAVCVWDSTADIKFSRAVRVHNGALVTSVAISADGTLGVSGSWDETVCVWNATSGEIIHPALQGHENAINSVALSEDGSTIASGSEDGDIRLWDATSGSEMLPVLRGHVGSVESLAFSSDGARILSGSSDCTVRVWDVSSGSEIISPLRGHARGISSIVFFDSGHRAISGSLDTTVRIWDVLLGTEVSPALLRYNEAVASVAVSTSGRIAAGYWDGSICIWDGTSGFTMLYDLLGHEGPINSMVFTLDGFHLFSASGDRSIRKWDINSGVLRAYTVEWTALFDLVGQN